MWQLLQAGHAANRRDAGRQGWATARGELKARQQAAAGWWAGGPGRRTSPENSTTHAVRVGILAE